jgi:hypothetical protein
MMQLFMCCNSYIAGSRSLPTAYHGAVPHADVCKRVQVCDHGIRCVHSPMQQHTSKRKVLLLQCPYLLCQLLLLLLQLLHNGVLSKAAGDMAAKHTASCTRQLAHTFCCCRHAACRPDYCPTADTQWLQ